MHLIYTCGLRNAIVRDVTTQSEKYQLSVFRRVFILQNRDISLQQRNFQLLIIQQSEIIRDDPVGAWKKPSSLSLIRRKLCECLHW